RRKSGFHRRRRCASPNASLSRAFAPWYGRRERTAPMQTENRLLDDLARVATGALGALTGVRSEIEQRLREQFERILGRMDLVTREEFDAVRAMAAKARAEQEALARRLAELEARVAESGGAVAPHPAASRPLRRRATPENAGEAGGGD